MPQTYIVAGRPSAAATVGATSRLAESNRASVVPVPGSGATSGADQESIGVKVSWAPGCAPASPAVLCITVDRASDGRPGNGRPAVAGLRETADGEQPLEPHPDRPDLHRGEVLGQRGTQPAGQVRPQLLQQLDRRRRQGLADPTPQHGPQLVDRKSTRLNSSHEWISYAVFCLKKKKKKIFHSYSTNKKKKTIP